MTSHINQLTTQLKGQKCLLLMMMMMMISISVAAFNCENVAVIPNKRRRSKLCATNTTNGNFSS